MAELGATALTNILASLGEDVTYTPFGGAGTTIRVRFDLGNIQVNPLTGEKAAFEPQCAALQSVVPNIKNKDTILKSGVTYEVIDFSKDEQGNFVLINLKKS